MKKERVGASVSLLPGFIFYSCCCSPQLLFSFQVARLLCVDGAVVSPPVRVGGLARRSGLSLLRCSEFSNSTYLRLWLCVWWQGGLLETLCVIIMTTILQVCSSLQLRSGLLFAMIMTMVNGEQRKGEKAHQSSSSWSWQQHTNLLIIWCLRAST